ncbi:MAG: hypothetical protein OSJ66_07345 [Clostridia bacterium]|nr:hypothetical protein [Clostridia bacterium]
MNNKQKVEHWKKVNEEKRKINKQLEEELRKIIRRGESLSNYELWLNEKCDILVETSYIIETYIKDFEKEKIVELSQKNNSLVYVLVKKNTEAEE